jgi:hypothetical protein
MHIPPLGQHLSKARARFFKAFALYDKVAFIDIEEDKTVHSNSPLIFDCMSQRHKPIAIDGSKMRTLCKSARGGFVLASFSRFDRNVLRNPALH